eukprot:gene9376-11110_t
MSTAEGKRAGGGDDTTGAVTRALDWTSSKDLFINYPCPPTQVDVACSRTISCKRLPVYFGGYYNKWARGLSQSPWLIDDEVHGDGSVQECIQHVVTVQQLQPADKELFDKLHEGERDKRKVYRAVVWVARAVQQSDLDKLSDMRELVYPDI